MLIKWSELPEEMRSERVKPYYRILVKKRFGLALKRVMDLILAIFMSILLAPVMLVIAVGIKLDSKGPVFYRQERVTQYGRVYRIFKFRTMVADADKKGPLVTKSQDDRITKMGKKLRKLRLDEIPQLWNIITGDMSFVGTRPEVKKYVDAYSDEMMATLLLPAGITSRTSIVFKDEDVLMEQYQKEEGKTMDEIYVEHILPVKMKYNLQYLQKFSVVHDIKIMMDTAFAVLK